MGSTTFLVAFHHSSFSVFVRICEDLLEESIQSAITAHIRILISSLLFLLSEAVNYALPILGFLRRLICRLGTDHGGAENLNVDIYISFPGGQLESYGTCRQDYHRQDRPICLEHA